MLQFNYTINILGYIMNIIPSISSGKNILIFNNQAGGGHRSAVEAIQQQILKNNGQVVIKDIFNDVLGQKIGNYLYESWNTATKNEKLDTLVNFTSKMQPFGEFFLALPEIKNVVTWLIENNINSVINPQPAGLPSIAKAVRIANSINEHILKNNRKIFIYNVLTELPTHQTTDFFNTYKSLGDEDRAVCKLISARPLLDKNSSEEEFWEQHTGFKLTDIIYDEFPVRRPFIEYINIDQKQIKELKIKVKNENAKQILNEISTFHDKAFQVGENSMEIGENDCVIVIMLGSQSNKNSTQKYVNDLINFYNNKNPDSKQFVFVCCGDHQTNGKEESLFSKISNLVKISKDNKQYPENLHVIPLENQNAEQIALLFRRSNVTITRSGGLTAMELHKLSTGQTYIHSTNEDPNQGMPEWEAGNARYLHHTKGAQIITTSNHPFLLRENQDPLILNEIRGFGIESFPNKGPKIGEQSFADLRIIPHPTETFEWKKKLIETAEKSIELSPNYAGGKGFRELLEVIEHRMQIKPELKVHLLCSDSLLETEDRTYLECLSKNPNFHYLITNMKINPLNFSIEENHVKLLVVDEKYFVLGGSSITEAQRREMIPNHDEESTFANRYFLPRAFRDTDVVGEGMIAERMRVEFFKLYNVWENRINNSQLEHYFPVEGNKGTNAIFQQEEGLFKNAKVRFFVGGPEHGIDNPITQAHLNLIRSANKCIRIANSQFNPDQRILDTLWQKKSEGIFIEGQFNKENQKMLIVYPSRPNYGVFNQVFEYDQGETFFHKKITVVDDQRLLIGSYNQSQKSLFDYEIALEIDDEDCAHQIVKELNKDHDSSIEYHQSDDIGSKIQMFAGKTLGLLTTKIT